MNRAFALGVALTALGVVGYLLGVSGPYPGRAFSITLLMVGVALVAMRRAFDATEAAA